MAGPARSTIEAIEQEEQKRREAIREELRQKLELEEKAHKIVERLLDNQDEQFLIDCSRFILPDHYKDVVEERAIAKQCGYPTCDKTLGPPPKQKYHISMKSNKVYDITDRKCFCSNTCYKSSKYYAAQISSVPLWMRDKDEPNLIKLLGSVELSNTSLPGQAGSGEEVILVDGIGPASMEYVSGMDESKPDQAEVSDDIMSLNFFRDENEHFEELGKDNEKLDEDEEDENTVSKDEMIEETKDVRNVDSKIATKTDTIKTVQEKHNKNIHHEDLKAKNQEPKILNILQPITESLKEWRTKRTLEFLNKSCYEHYDSNKPSGTATKTMESTNQGNDVNPVETTGNVEDRKRGVSESTRMESQKVGSLTEQKMQAMEEEAYRLRVESLFYGEESKQLAGKNKKDVKENVTDDKPIAMPYVDSQSQMSIRRKILLDRLNRAFSEFLGPLHLSIREFSSDLNCLVQTFHLGNKNMTFKPIGWTLLAVIILIISLFLSFVYTPMPSLSVDLQLRPVLSVTLDCMMLYNTQCN
ncbi:putative RNA polymerase II subunit B1 CTD phosphatase rpap2 [Anneissia japonica]|uniref:putative RNA polymerase II subunit B1 CTD phosphatase rpap2 n=1 Tax=Anneissia japonica TaxID=1529436 RepID=UPI0014254EE9|nr:putative RNA polymerase II subunit B1 CTD phosphatase rpap2 [Anneissia japonica]XP_033105317.1 putative RNA polymerase II subunit B1 CTD phosphatase rpap2 [Anneissia japonica]XP_033105325.1 putative RNA polymerase II subunit B1 CTD phosphatase rpap2 [Anneissia japonica]XP_033105330.1 putative RNA polymerase II subunit B1 CTD phosphatase rpap2 [Anneissia japonica]